MRRGFTLYETLLTVFLLSLALVILGELMMTFSRAQRAASDRSRRLRGLETALTLLGSEIRQADSLTVTGSPARIRVVRDDPASDRWTTPRPTLEVTFQVQHGKLIRETVRHAASDEVIGRSELLDEVTDLRCTTGTVQDYAIALTAGQRTLKTTVVGPSR